MVIDLSNSNPNASMPILNDTTPEPKKPSNKKEPTNLSNLVYQDSNMPYNPTTYIPNTDNLSNSDIFIIHDCYGSNFIRKVMTILEAEGFGDSRQLAQNFDDMPDSMSA